MMLRLGKSLHLCFANLLETLCGYSKLLGANTILNYSPLAPNACHNAELRFIALATGVLNLDGIRVVDLLTNEITDCRDLPSIVCVNKD